MYRNESKFWWHLLFTITLGLWSVNAQADDAVLTIGVDFDLIVQVSVDRDDLYANYSGDADLDAFLNKDVIQNWQRDE